MPKKLETQYDRVRSVLMTARSYLTLYRIGALIKRRWGAHYSDAAISARVRELRADLLALGKTVHSTVVPGKSYHRYRVLACP